MLLFVDKKKYHDIITSIDEANTPLTCTYARNGNDSGKNIKPKTLLFFHHTKLFALILAIFRSLYIVRICTETRPNPAHVHCREASDLQLCLRSHQLNWLLQPTQKLTSLSVSSSRSFCSNSRASVFCQSSSFSLPEALTTSHHSLLLILPSRSV